MAPGTGCLAWAHLPTLQLIVFVIVGCGVWLTIGQSHERVKNKCGTHWLHALYCALSDQWIKWGGGSLWACLIRVMQSRILCPLSAQHFSVCYWQNVHCHLSSVLMVTGNAKYSSLIWAAVQSTQCAVLAGHRQWISLPLPWSLTTLLVYCYCSVLSLPKQFYTF